MKYFSRFASYGMIISIALLTSLLLVNKIAPRLVNQPLGGALFLISFAVMALSATAYGVQSIYRNRLSNKTFPAVTTKDKFRAALPLLLIFSIVTAPALIVTELVLVNIVLVASTFIEDL